MQRRRARAPWALLGLGLLAGLAIEARHLRGLRAPLPPQRATPRVVGSVHVHTERSHDSRVPVAAYAAAAAARGLHFVVLTDHNVAPSPPQVLHGVLVLSQVERSTAAGHLLELSDAGAGGSGVAAHPTDAHRPYTGALAPLRGLEIANASAAARAVGGRTLLGLVPLALGWGGAGEAALGALYRRDDAALALWDAAGAAPRAGLCGVDAHGWLPLGPNLGIWQMALALPDLQPPLREADAPRVLRALLEGRALCLGGPLGPQPALEFFAADAHGTARALAGGRAPTGEVARLTAELQVGPASDLELVLLRDGAIVQRGVPAAAAGRATCRAELTSPGPGAYRVEVRARRPGLVPGRTQALVLAYTNRIVLEGPAP